MPFIQKVGYHHRDRTGIPLRAMNQNLMSLGDPLVDPLNTLPYPFQRKWLNIGKPVVIEMDCLRKTVGVVLVKVKDRSKLIVKLDIRQPAEG